MALIKGGFLRILQTILYALAFLCSAVILGIYSYFLATLADRNAFIANWARAVTGISGAAVLYTIFAVILTCCLGGVAFFAFLGIVLDIAFVGGMIAIAILTRDGASSCTGIVTTPLGTGPATGEGQGFDGQITYAVSQRTACRLNTAAFAVSIIGAFVFVITAGMQVVLVRHHKKEKRFGPSPSNNYTSGYGKRKFWQRKPKNVTRDTEAGVGPDVRTSYETGTTVGNGNTALNAEKVDHAAPPAAHSGYYTQPQGTGVNPYGYEQRGPNTNF